MRKPEITRKDALAAARKMFEVGRAAGNKAFGRKIMWEFKQNQPHAVEAWIAIGRWYLEKMRARK